MPKGAITGYIDVAQIVLYAFWIFFAGLIFYLRREDRREGYPLESEVAGVGDRGFLLIPTPKTFDLGQAGLVFAPRVEAPRDVAGEKVALWPGAPIEPVGDPMTAGVGPGSYALRADVADVTFDGRTRIVPMRVDDHFTIAARDPDPRGMTVAGADRAVAGVVADVWVDRSELLARYYEVELAEGGGRRVLLPVTFAVVDGLKGIVNVRSILGAQFAGVPPLRSPDSVTRLEEDKITAYYGAGTLYATPARAEPLL
ncbi:photosynthetic reaction center subunit H [Alsobacter sp. KACC 23698]|uniref:Photosynthetic reaction center subunit H n=1 Tax=Alsobacter sp. KACC 23698 TaxID=3149229 RepID=A0AAU7JDW4_9HYPH